MRKCQVLMLAIPLTGCAGMDRQDKVGVTIVSVVAGLALAASASKDDDDEPATQCRTIIRPNQGGGIGTNVTIC